MIQVAAAILWNMDKVLICQRGAGGNCAYLWEFPGGKVEPGETLEDCLIRECNEELGVPIYVQDIFAKTTYRYPDREIAFTFFNAFIKNGKPKASVHQALKWVTLDQLQIFEFCPADVGIVKKLISSKFSPFSENK